MPTSTKKSKIDWKAPKLQGMCFAFTGRFKKDNKKWMLDWIKQEGAQALPDVTDKATYLIVGEKTGSAPTAQEQKAAKLNQKGASIQVTDEAGFWSLLTPTRDECIAMLNAGNAGCQRWNQFHPKNGWLCQLMPIPDLSGADFRGADWRRPDHHETTFHGVRLDGADLRGAKLQSCDSLVLSSVDLEGASFNYVYIKAAVDCNFRNATISHCHFDSNSHLDRSDFTGATISESTFFYDMSGSNVVFKKVKSNEVEFRRCKLPGADFSSADLTGAAMDECDFSGAKFAGAILSGALLHKAKLKDADLRKADLRNANLAGADLSGANIDGADFTGANLAGVKLGGVDTSRAKGLKPVTQPATTSQAGPNLQQLAAIAKQAGWLQTSMKVERDGQLTVTMEVWSRDLAKTCFGHSIEGEQYLGRKHECVGNNLPDLFAELAGQWGAGELLSDSLSVDIKKGPVRKNALQPIALAAWYEVFGRTPPSAQDLQATRQQARDEFISLLKKGKKGVEQWNADINRLEKAGSFQGVDLSGLDLTGIHLHTLDFSGARFDKAVLTKARTGYGGISFKQASFREADLSEASLTDADCTGADFTGARFPGSYLQGQFAGAVFKNADFSSANVWGDFRGTDLSAAKLANAKWFHAKFDEHTKWPKGFKIPKELKWAGTGPDPRIAKALQATKSAGPIDFAAFFERLQLTVDADRLKKALAMLKADRFKLYADVKDDRLVGIVKSQTDKDLVYSCKLAADGSYACCTQNLNICGGLRGSLCKHLLVLIVGLTKGGELAPATVDAWVDASRLQKPALDKDAMSETFLRYKGAEAGEVDWRPTETIPEDYYAM